MQGLIISELPLPKVQGCFNQSVLFRREMELVFQSVTSMLGLKTSAVQPGSSVTHTIVYPLISPALPGEVSVQAQGSQSSIFNPLVLQTIVNE